MERNTVNMSEIPVLDRIIINVIKRALESYSRYEGVMVQVLSDEGVSFYRFSGRKPGKRIMTPLMTYYIEDDCFFMRASAKRLSECLEDITVEIVEIFEGVFKRFVLDKED